MAARIADIASSTNATLPTVTPADFGWVRNTGAGAILVSPPAGAAFKGLAVGATISLPAGKELLCTAVGSPPYIHAKQGTP